MSRLFYDPSSPVMLSEDQVARMSSAEVQAATQQMDQILVSQLQRIEENFALSTQILNDVILQQVQKHGENSQAIYESIKFWRPFFEAAARTKLSDPYGAAEPSIIADPSAIDPNPAEQSLEFDQPSVGQVTDQGTPRQPSFTRSPGQDSAALPTPTQGGNDSAGWPGAPPGMSPLETLQADWRRVAASPEAAAGVDLEAVRKGIDALATNPSALDSPSLAMPDLSLDNSPAPQPAPSLPKPKPSTSSLDPPRSPGGARLRAGAAQHHPALLQKVLQKQLLSPRPPGASTPAKGGKAAFPTDIPRGWNGVADLAETSLTAFASPIERRADAGDESWAGDFGAPSVAGGSPAPEPPAARTTSPPPMSYALSPAKYSATPAKEAAKRAARFAYDAEDEDEDGDLAPPSVLKNYTTRYDFTLDQGGSPVAPSPSEGLRKGFEEEAYGDEEDEDEEEAELPAAPAHLADFGGGTTARIDDLLAGQDEFAPLAEEADFGGLVVDDEEGVRPDLVDDDEEYEAEYDDDAAGQNAGAEEESYVVEEGISHDAGPEGPQDTLFGMPQKKVAFDGEDVTEEDSFGPGQRGGRAGEFRMLGFGPDEMQTLHGGDLLDSEPFEGSPLAGRDRGGY